MVTLIGGGTVWYLDSRYDELNAATTSLQSLRVYSQRNIPALLEALPSEEAPDSEHSLVDGSADAGDGA